MFVIPGIVVLVTYVYVRPHEIFEALRTVSFPMVASFGLFGYLVDVKVGAARLPRPSPLLLFGGAFFGWAILTTAINAPDALSDNLFNFAAPIALFFLTSQAIGGVRSLSAVSGVVLVVTLFLTIVGIHQGLSPTVCIPGEMSTASAAAPIEGRDFRPCTVRQDCLTDGNEGDEFLCEHTGVFGTTSIGGRVRYRGIFQDPNELAWAMSMSLPLAFAWLQRRLRDKRVVDRILIVAIVLAVAVCNVMTKSRSGQISLIATLGVYFARRFGWRGIAAGAVLALPLLLLGGRSDDSSTQERLECWSQALDLWREHPFFGVGARQFNQHHYLTAHNSALLALAEQGPIGLVLFTATIYAAFKMVLQIQRDFAGRPEAQPVHATAFAMLAGLTGMVVSALFLSLSYHMALWIQLGLVGAIQTAIWRHDPGWRLRWGWRDGAAVLSLDAALVVGVAIYLRLKGV